MRTLSILFATALTLGALLPWVHQWEREQGFPYGKMCHSIFTGYVDTCPR